jgi:hypothetical protein
VIFDSGVPLVHVPCANVAEQLRTTVPELERYARGRGPLGEYLFEIFRDYVGDRYAASRPLWDVAAVAYLVEPAWVPAALLPSPRLSSEHTWHRDPARHPIRTALRVERDLVLADLFRKLDAHASGAASRARGR